MPSVAMTKHCKHVARDHTAYLRALPKEEAEALPPMGAQGGSGHYYGDVFCKLCSCRIPHDEVEWTYRMSAKDGMVTVIKVP